MWWRMVVWGLLTAPTAPELDGGTYPPEAMAALKVVARELEVADSREYWSEHFAGELRACRWRLQELEGAPRLVDAYWLPPAAVCHANAEMARGMAQGIRKQMGFCAWEDQWMGRAAAEMEQRALIWWYAEVAADPLAPVYRRRIYLSSLRAHLGPEGWCACALPPPVPCELLPQH